MYKLSETDCPKFLLHKIDAFPIKYLTFRKLMHNISNLTGLISFTAKITNRKFIKPQEFSRTSRKLKRFGFGFQGKSKITICLLHFVFFVGDKTHQLEFRSGSKFIVLFLNNWESLQMPLGLLPGMKVNISNVLVQKKKYLKSTILTRIDVVRYEPKVDFQTVNM